MAIVIQPYTKAQTEAVKGFNQRLAAGGVPREFHFPECDVPLWLSPQEGSRIYQRYYLALENEFVRGGFILKYQDFALRGSIRTIPYYHLPISEGIVNKAYAGVGVFMLRTALKMEPMLYALGMGGFDRPLPTMLKALGWSMAAVPFFYRVVHPSRFLRNISPMQQSRLRRAIGNLAAFSGLGWAGIKFAHRWRTSNRNATSGISGESIGEFGPWVEELWQRCLLRYPLIAGRNTDVLQRLYPAGKNFLCFKVSRGAQAVGWVVTRDTQMLGNKYFGDLRVGTIADCLAVPEEAPAVAQIASKLLQERGVDLIICNHSHAHWGAAFRGAGFFSASSNFIFAASPALAKEMAPFESDRDLMYFMRGDGDGPVNL